MYFSGIIAEYNPLHKGHKRHIELTKRETGCENTVVIMSGCFTQRGEPAVFDKWARTRMALCSGADLVLELPATYALGSAERFASGAVSILDSIGTAAICFGSETADISQLERIADILADEPEDYKAVLKSELRKGVSFPAARQAAAASILGRDADALAMPNSILGIEYIKAIKRIGSNMRAVSVMREGSGYNAAQMSGELSSALAIRTALERGDKSAYSALPVSSQIWCDSPVFCDDMTSILLYSLRTKSIEELSALYSVNEGMEYKLYRAARKCTTYDELLNELKSKRYTLTRIKRMLVSALLNITDDLTERIDQSGLYARVLGIRKSAKPLLGHISRNSKIPVITQPNKSLLTPGLELDLRASDTYALLGNISPAARDYTEGLIIVD